MVNAYRYLPALLCKCMDGYYDNGTQNNICASCHYSCLTCNAGDRCLSCKTVNYRTLNSTSQLCDCKDGYFDSGSPIC